MRLVMTQHILSVSRVASLYVLPVGYAHSNDVENRLTKQRSFLGSIPRIEQLYSQMKLVRGLTYLTSA